MEFLNPSALLGLSALPLLLIPYLIRRRPRRMMFSSLLLFMTGADQATRRPWGKPNLPPIFFLQLLLLALLIFALSEPVFSVRPTNIAVVLDNSASMQALEAGKSRFDLAGERAAAVLRDLGVGATAAIYLTAPRMEKLSAAPLAPAEAINLIGSLAPYDLGNPPIDYDMALGRLAQERQYERVYLITDRPARGQSAAARVISVGAPRGNLAVTAFDVYRSSLADARLQANAEVANFSNRDEKIKISLKTGGKTLGERQLTVGAGKTAAASFAGFPEHPYYLAEIDAGDALALDNRRYAVLPASRELKILAVTPRPQAASSLRSIPGVSVDVIAPAEYEKTARFGYGLEIFQFSAPATLPQNPALFILPPENIPLARLGAPMARAEVSGWREPHALTRYINFSLFQPAYARPMTPRAAGESIIETTGGALAVAHEHRGARFLTLGFDPLPYLGRSNLPMSIFTLNSLDWLFSSGARSRATGEPISLGVPRPNGAIITPTGEKIALTAERSYFANTFHQGIYQVNRGGAPEYFARNLADADESDLRSPPVIELRGSPSAGAGASVLFSFWPYLLMASLLLLFLEWFLSPGASGAAAGRQPRRVAWKS
jgi:hypothetical protein